MTEIEVAVGLLVDRMVDRGVADVGADRVVQLLLHAIGAHPAVRHLRTEAVQHGVVGSVTRAQIVQALRDVVTRDPHFARELTAALGAGGRTAGGVMNVHAGSSHNVVMARDIAGGVHINPRADRDVDIILQTEGKRFNLTEETGSLTIRISCRSVEPVRVALRALGMPPGTWEIVPTVVSVSREQPAQAEIRLKRGATSPDAGNYDLRIVGENVDRPDAGLWESNTKSVGVPPAPNVESWVEPVSRIAAGGRHRVSLMLHNTGNTWLDPTVTSYSLDDDSEVKYSLQKDAVRVVGKEPQRMPPDGEIKYDVDITLPARGLLDREWSVPLRIDVNRKNLSKTDKEFQIVQYGLMSAVAVRLGHATGRTPSQHALGAAMVGIALVLLIVLITIVTQSSGPDMSATGVTLTSTSPGLDSSAVASPPEKSSTSPLSPTDVIRSYYAAVNRHDFRAAYLLGEGMIKRQEKTYDEWVQGYANTIKSTLTIVRTSGNEVCVQLIAEESNPAATTVYSGCYIVADGVIDSGHVVKETSQPSTTR